MPSPKATLTNWKTTLCGVCIVLGVLSQVLLMTLDGDAETNPQWELVVPEILAGIALIFARDADKSSEESGISK